MGGRGGAGGGGSRNTSSPDYKSSYNIEMENARSFEAAFAIEDGTTKGAIGYQIVKRRVQNEISVHAGNP